jgi:hypothetical protein
MPAALGDRLRVLPARARARGCLRGLALRPAARAAAPPPHFNKKWRRARGKSPVHVGAGFGLRAIGRARLGPRL